MRYFILSCLIGCCLLLKAQYTPKVSPKQEKIILIKNATIHIGNGDVISESCIVLKNGKIDFIGKIPPNYTDAIEIDATGKHVYPGLIAPNTVLGLKEIESTRATLDDTETGDINSDARTIIAYNAESQVIPTVRTNGILLSQIVPNGGSISGTSSIVQLDAWNWEDAAIKMEDGIHLNWPSSFERKGWWAEPEDGNMNNKYKLQTAEINKFFEEAKAYYSNEPVVKNLRYRALRLIFAKRQPLYIRANEAFAILDAMMFAKKLDIKIIIVGGKESYLIANEIAKNNVPVIYDDVHDLPTNNDEDIDQPFKTPAVLQKAGVLYCLSIKGSWQVRNLPFIAGTTVRYGIDKEQALKSITYNTARILGIDANYGSLEINKSATLVISSGDLLDMKSNNIEFAFIDGRQIELGNKQVDLYKKYQEKYKAQGLIK